MNLLINARFLTQQITGTQRYAREVTREIVKLLGPDNICLMAPEQASEEFAGVPVLRCGGPLKGHFWEQVVLPRMVDRRSADLLWCPGNCGPLLVRNQVVTIHGTEVFAVPDGFNPYFVRWYRFLLPGLAQRALRVLTVSQFSKNELVKYLKIAEERVCVIYNGVDRRFIPQPEQKVAAFKRKHNLPERYVLLLASRTPRKNFRRVLEAWTAIHSKPEPNGAGLVVAGGLTRSLQGDAALAKLVTMPRICDLGYVADEDLPALYGGATVFAFPSLYEGFGLPPLEAMACGTPVVVSNVASLPEVVGDAGVYVDPYDVEDIARGIYRVLADEGLRRRLREKGLARAKLFTWEKTARKTLEVFEEVLQEQRSKTK
ncbi:MAG TPA: glycosyltransferase family 1 protein [Desulfotomaculum sp.]|nr:glycosyltransferase family 1 protein [Desulfotomaculum sp.]